MSCNGGETDGLRLVAAFRAAVELRLRISASRELSTAAACSPPGQISVCLRTVSAVGLDGSLRAGSCEGCVRQPLLWRSRAAAREYACLRRRRGGGVSRRRSLPRAGRTVRRQTNACDDEARRPGSWYDLGHQFAGLSRPRAGIREARQCAEGTRSRRFNDLGRGREL